MRLDARLVAAGRVASRSRASDLIKRGLITLDGRKLKASEKVSSLDFDRLVIDDHPWVSRAALKLEEALKQRPSFAPQGQACIDIGASTGGFTQVLLANEAAHVLAVDVGHDQLHKSLLSHPLITNLQGFNAKDLQASDLSPHQVTRLVSDVSFISVTKALEPALDLLSIDAQALILVKPQFEVGRDGLTKDGLAKDPEFALEIVKDWLLASHPSWTLAWIGDSPIVGGDGNREFLLHLVKT